MRSTVFNLLPAVTVVWSLLAGGAQATMSDPTAPPGIQPSSKPTVRKVEKPRVDRLQLQQILYRKQSPLVVINNQRLGVGDNVQGFRVWRIEPRRVGVEQGGQRYWLALYPSVVKK